jgi:DNA gyrase subunit A
VAEIGDSPARSDRSRITVTELPYQVNKANLIERIAELVNQGKLSDIADLRDESDQRGVSIVIELKRGTQPRKVLNQLYKHTFLQTTFAVQMLALVDKEPRLLSLKRALQIHIDHRVEVITRRIQFELDKALKRQHILEGLMIALNHLDEVIETIRRSDDAESARGQLIERFGLSEAQATAILDMQLRRLAALERQKIEAEYAEITAHIAHLRHLLSDKKEILAIIREDVAALKKDFGDARRTKIEAADGELRDEDLVRDENILISITRRGYIKRTPVSAYRKQARGGRGLIGMGTRDEDELEHLFAAGSLNTILLFSDSGKVYAVKAYEIPELDRTAKGTSLMNIVPLQSDEKITAALPVRSFEDAQYLTMITRRGRIKRVAVNEFRNVRSNGLIAVNLDDKDALGWVKLTQGEQDMILVSQQGHGIRFREEDVRAMGRTAIGVYAMRLADGDELAGADVVIPDGDLLLITEKGVGKRTPLDEYRQQGRYGKGVQVMKLDPKRSGNIVSARVVTRDDEMTCISSNGLILRTAVHNISRQGRYSQGVSVMDLKADDSVVSVAVIREGYLSQANGEEPEIAEEETAVAADSETVDTVPVE